MCIADTRNSQHLHEHGLGRQNSSLKQIGRKVPLIHLLTLVPEFLKEQVDEQSVSDDRRHGV